MGDCGAGGGEHDPVRVADRAAVKAADRLRAARGVRQRYRTDRRTFVRMVGDVVQTLPEPFRERLQNVAIVVAESQDDEHDVGTNNGSDDSEDDTELLGLYQGVPYGERLQDYNMVLPDRITIYRQAILASSRNEAEAREEVRLTVLHEIGHYFGLDEAELP
jgi:predicted Zn-dependent protease with MMP-like domain